MKFLSQKTQTQEMLKEIDENNLAEEYGGKLVLDD